MSPLTPAEAIALAAILDAHTPRLPHWDAWAERLRTWAHQQITAASEEGEMPSQTGFPEAGDGTMGTDVNEPRTAYLLVRQSEALTDLGGRSVIDSSKSSGA